MDLLEISDSTHIIQYYKSLVELICNFLVATSYNQFFIIKTTNRLQKFQSTRITNAIQCPYSKNDDWTITMTITLKLLTKNMRNRNRILTLAYAFYAGKLLNNHDEPRQT